MRILVTGSRDWVDRGAIKMALLDVAGEGVPPVIVHGGCSTGADAIASSFARNQGWVEEVHHPAWHLLGRRAGPTRNARMVAHGADVAFAFILNGSRGATHCAGLIEAAGIPLTTIEKVDE